MKKIIFFLTIVLLPALAFCQLKITAGTNLTTAGNVHIVLADMDFINNGILDATGSTLQFSGVGNSNILGNSIYFQNITVNKPVGKQLNLLGTLYVNGQVNFMSGNIELNDKEILLGNTGSLVGESETSRATSNNYGLINATGILNAPNAVNLANLGIIITSPVNMGLVSITRNFDSQNLPTGGGKSIFRNFGIFPSVNAGLNATVTMKYFDAELNGLDENKLTQFGKDGYFVYSDRNFSARNAAANFVTQTGYDNFYQFTLGNALVILPVKLISFTAQCTGNFIQLNWKTAMETNSDRFDIQRSDNRTSWQKIGSVKAKGNSTGITAYQYGDHALNAPSAFYRLAAVDLDGKIVYSPVVEAGCNKGRLFKVLPNPVTDVATILIGGSENSTGTLVLYNSAGQKIMQQEVALKGSSNQYQVNMTSFARGNYTMVLLQNGAVSQHITIIKQ